MALGATETGRLLKSVGLVPSRALGQNFVVDTRIIERIVESAGVDAASKVVEIGPGVGALTVHLAATGAHVVAIEKDRGLAGVLAGVLDRAGCSRNVDVITEDALEVDWQALLEGGGRGGSHAGGDQWTARDASVRDGWTLVANLPYNVAVPILLDLLADAPMVSSLFVMTQLEVAERLCASPGGRTIGVPTIKAGWYASARIIMRVPPEVFLPQPRVESAVIALTRRPPPRTDVEPDEVFRFVEVAYRKRRKMLRSSLGELVDGPAFGVAGIDPQARPETLGIDDWANLAVAAGALAP